MIIKPYIDTDLPTIRLNSSMAQIKTALNAADCLAVLDDQDQPAGLLTCTDLDDDARTAGECAYIKPFVGPDEKLLDVISLMKQTGHSVLPVEEDGRFSGVIRSAALLHPLAETVRKYQVLFQHVTHDLRNPIGNIFGIFSLLEESLVKPENKDIVRYGQEACTAALAMLNELLGIEKKDNDTSGFRITDLAAFIVQCIEQLKGIFISKDIGVETCLTSEDFYARIDPLHLQRVIHNLLSNAVKFSPQGGRIEVSSEIKNDRFRLAIKDHGIGIPFEMQALVFDRFTTAQRQGTSGEASTGLGLYFARQTVDLHGGRIWFESEVGQGTTFFIELPRY